MISKESISDGGEYSAIGEGIKIFYSGEIQQFKTSSPKNINDYDEDSMVEKVSID